MQLADFIKANSKNNKLPLPEDHNQRVEACLALQIHTTGARPAFMTNDYGFVKPETYKKKYDKLFKTRLLNRHPNENPIHYNWRLSVYSPVQKEPFDKFNSLCKGSILQANNYTITADDNTSEWMVESNFEDAPSGMLDFILQNPFGYIGVISVGEYSATERAKVKIVCIKCEDVLMKDEESIAFTHGGKIYFIDDSYQHEIGKNEVLSAMHNFGEMPIWLASNSFLQPYVFWSDLLTRNMNDDEAMSKHYAYPVVQMVEPECVTCQGSGLQTTIEDGDINTAKQSTCKTCNGRKTMTRNPGDNYTVSEETLARNGGSMQDFVKFITPDVSIPEYHLKRWQVFYERVEGSLYLRVVTDGVQSGDAKVEDRKDQYAFYQVISDYLFSQIRKSLTYVSKYLNPNTTNSEIYVVAPKQFDLMSDSDIVNEFAKLQTLTDDSQTLSELAYVVNSKIYRDDEVQKKINDVMYYADPLYGVSGQALKSKMISGVYSSEEITIHEKGYKFLVRMARMPNTEAFLAADIDAIIAKLKAEIPKGIYE